MTGTATRPHDVGQLAPLLTRITGDEKHAPSAHSTLDVLWVLFDRVLRVSPDRLEHPDRDRFLLSKGHGPAAYYAVLAAKGFIPSGWLDDLAGPNSRLGHHPDRLLVPGVEIGSGSLGHGPGLGVGTASGLRAQGSARAAGVRVARRRRTERGLEPRGDRVRRSHRPGQPHRHRGGNRFGHHGWPGGIDTRFTVNG